MSSSRDGESRAETYLRRYKTFVRRNRALLAAIEQGAAGLTWLVPDGENAHIYAEATSSAIGVAATLNDHLVGDGDDDVADDHRESDADAVDAPRDDLTTFDDDSARGSDGSGGSGAGSPSRRAKPASWDARVSAFFEALPIPVCLNLVSQVEVLAEMLAKRRARRRGDDDDLGPTLAVEALKVALKTALWADQRGKLLVDDGLTPDQLGDEPNEAGERSSRRIEHEDADARSRTRTGVGVLTDAPPGERRAAVALHALREFRTRARADAEAREIAKITARREEASRETRDDAEVDVDARSSTAGGPTSASAPVSKNRRAYPSVPSYLAPVPLPPPGLTLADVLEKEKARLTLKMTGEALHIARPLLHAASMRRHGRKSWRPFLLSACVDAAMFTCLNAAAGKDEAHFSPGERREMRRRRAALAYYLLRSPAFESVTRPAIGAVGWALRPVPLVGSLYGKAAEIADDVNEHFAYTY